VAKTLSEAASVPVYGLFDTYIGQGIVGGSMSTFDDLGAQAGRLALRVLAGSGLPPLQDAASTTIVDWRQLQRWGIPESHLPADATIRFKEPSLWEQHRALILTTIAVVLAQTLLIIALAMQERRRRRAERKYRESEERIHLATTAAHLGLWQWNADADQVWVNDIGREIAGLKFSPAFGLEQFLGSIHPDDRKKVLTTFREAADNGQPFNSECHFNLADGSESWVTAIGTQMSATKEAKRLTGVLIDVTRERQIELESEQRRKDLAHLSRVALLGELSGAVAHELNQPLTAILGNAQAAQRFFGRNDADMTEVRGILEDIVADGRRAGEVIRRLRALFRKGEAQIEPVDLNQVTTEVLELAHADFIARKIRVRTDLASDLPPVQADRVQVQQVLLNLIVNACDAMKDTPPNDRALILKTAADGLGMARISVIDHGTGLAEPTRIFEPFVSSKKDGLGLGLSICRSIVAAHGGRLWADNNPGRGATFAVALPIGKSS
jgi:PAS domain S-box-containing protein